ncbi:MAG: hypothetical protein WDN69_06670 [Aliidongia sp.]
MNAFDNLAIRGKDPPELRADADHCRAARRALAGSAQLRREQCGRGPQQLAASAGQMSKLFTAIYNYRVREGRYLLMATEGTGSLDEGQADIDKATAELAAARQGL